MPGTIILGDNSGSMDDVLPNGMTSREALIAVLIAVVQEHPGIRTFAFSSHVVPVGHPREWPRAGGGTDLAGALHYLREFKPDRVVTISDGLPNDAKAALTAAILLNTAHDCRYVGAPDDIEAVQFMRELARCSRKGTHGSSGILSLTNSKQAAEELVRLAAPPKA
jgi:hypothetical protein